MVERDAAAVRALQANRDAAGCDAVEVVRADALEFLQHRSRAATTSCFSIRRLPMDCWPQLLALLPQCLAPGALVYCEARASALDAGPGWEVVKARPRRAGQLTNC